MVADLVGARPRSTGSRSPAPARSTSQWSRVVGSVNALGHGDHLGAAHGEDPVQLGEAQVVADAHPQPDAVGQLRDDDLDRRAARSRTPRRGRRRPRRRTCGSCGRRRGARRRGRRGRSCWRALLLAGDALDDRAGDAGRSRARAAIAARPARSPGRRAAGRRRAICSPVPSTLHFSGSTTSSAPRRGGLADEPVGGREVAIGVVGRVELDRAGAHDRLSRLTVVSRQPD